MVSRLISGILMSIGFGVLLPCAAIASRYLKGHVEKYWLAIHITFASLSVIAILAGYYFAQNIYQPQGELCWHGVFGMALMVGVGIQACSGILIRYLFDPLRPDRPWYDKIHGALGATIIVLGLCNILWGLKTLHSISLLPRSIFNLYLCWTVALVIIFAYLEIYIGASSRYSSGNIFLAAKEIGTDKLFAMNSKDRKKSIDIVSTQFAHRESTTTLKEPHQPESDDTTSAGTHSPAMYKPKWGPADKKEVKRKPSSLSVGASRTSLHAEDQQPPQDILNRAIAKAQEWKGKMPPVGRSTSSQVSPTHSEAHSRAVSHTSSMQSVDTSALPPGYAESMVVTQSSKRPTPQRTSSGIFSDSPKLRRAASQRKTERNFSEIVTKPSSRSASVVDIFGRARGGSISDAEHKIAPQTPILGSPSPRRNEF
ncbi:hypothetical protein EDD86DRAFT_220871 [Gorgonomyces haynaldii]|nr:hypothetical protein EDD86DRAFT_220871 [Gorgonomyces haynaldii]